MLIMNFWAAGIPFKSFTIVQGGDDGGLIRWQSGRQYSRVGVSILEDGTLAG